jgi:iron(III) transport system permease protein
LRREGPGVWRSSAPWTIGSGVIVALVVAPLAALALVAGRGSPDLWQHLVAYVLPAAIRDTVLLLVGVGALSAVIGSGMAWLVTAYDFPGRKVLDWALLLPLAVPTYIIAFAYLDLLHPVGPVQTTLRMLLGFESPRQFRLPDVRSLTGCVLLLGFVLYPYVYLTTRAMFVMQAANLLDVARTLGTPRRALFLRVGLPLARPAVAIGLSLALMEALNDIGASEFLGVRTLTVSIYATWVTRADLPGAAQMALTMLAIVSGLVIVERWARRQRRYADDAQDPRPASPQRVRGLPAALATVVASVPVALGFVIPAVYLVDASIARIRLAGLSPGLMVETLNTVVISLVASAVTLACGIAVAYSVRVGRGPLAGVLARVASLGYAVPGTVLAIGLLPVVTQVDALLDAMAGQLLGTTTGLVMLGSGMALVYAYLVRFLAVAAGGVEAGFSRLAPSLDAAAQTLGDGAGRRLRRVHLPLARPALAAAALLVFVDCMKELPATLLLRPVGFETLATHLYGEAVRGTYEDAAVAALLIVAAGLVPVLLLARLGRAGASRSPMRSP